MSDEAKRADDFSVYPFPRNLRVDVRIGHYQVVGDDGQEEVVQAENAKDAMTKTKFQKVEKLTYMGFYTGTIVSSKLLSQDIAVDSAVDSGKEEAQEAQTQPQEEETKDDTSAA